MALQSHAKLTRPRIPTLARGTAVHAKGRARVEQILQAAVEIFAFEGYAAFTMRRIAKRCGISLRNLQYYFRTKRALFQAAVELRLAQDLASARRTLEGPDGTARERLLAFIELSIEENTSPLVRGFQFELWAMATRDPFAASCLDRMSKAYCDFIVRLIKPIAPRLAPAQARRKAALLLATLQGVPLVASPDLGISAINRPGLRRMLATQAIALVTHR